MAILDRSGYLNTVMRVSGAQSASRRIVAFRELLSALLSFSFWIFSFSFYFFFVLVLVFVNENRTDVDAGKAGVRVASGARLMRLRFTLEEVVGRPAIKCVHSLNLTVETWLIQFVYFLFCFLFCTEYLFTVQRSTYCCMLHCEGSL